MTANDYQKAAMKTASDACRSSINAALGLTGEAGAVAEAVKKSIYHDMDLDAKKVAGKLGDVIWYVALMAEIIGCSMEDIMRMNIEKLEARYGHKK